MQHYKNLLILLLIFLFLLRNVVNRFKFSLASFVTTGAKSSQMFPFVWKAISICELHLLKSLAVTCEWLKKMTWTLILMLHIGQSFHLVLKNVLSTSYLMFNIWWKQHETVYTILVKVYKLDTCGKMVCSHLGITFLIFLHLGITIKWTYKVDPLTQKWMQDLKPKFSVQH